MAKQPPPFGHGDWVLFPKVGEDRIVLEVHARIIGRTGDTYSRSKPLRAFHLTRYPRDMVAVGDRVADGEITKGAFYFEGLPWCYLITAIEPLESTSDRCELMIDMTKDDSKSKSEVTLTLAEWKRFKAGLREHFGM